MEEFLTKLNSYENFSTYLIISIIILIFLFIVILFYGKKDQKKREIEATKKLMQINEETINNQFAEETSKAEQQKLENDTIIVPNISDIMVDNNVNLDNTIEESIPEPVIPPIESVDNPLVDETPIANLNEEISFKEETTPEIVEVPKHEIEYPNFNNITDISEPVLSSNEEKPFEFNDFNFNGNIISPVTPEIYEVHEEVNNEIPAKDEIKVPEFDFDKIVKNVEEVAKEEKIRGPEIFSSVYVPQKEEKVEEIKNEENDDEEFELPTLKREIEAKKEEIDVPKLNDYNLDEISGETYNIR